MSFTFDPLIFSGLIPTSASGGSPSFKNPVATVSALPSTGNTDGDVRVTLDTDEIWVWNAASARWVDVGLRSAVVGITPNADGYNLIFDNSTPNLTLRELELEPADATHPGILTTGTQTIAGNKTLTGQLNMDGNSIINVTAVPNGVATLDGSGKVPYSELPSALMTYRGAWNPTTNTPTLANGTGLTGDTYRASVGGASTTPISDTWFAGDFIIYNGTIWQRSPLADGVISVNGMSGAVTLTQGNLTDVGTDGITVTNGTNAVWGSGTSIAQQKADATHNGYLSSTDWSSFSAPASGVAGAVQFSNGSGLLTSDDANLHFNDSNHRLGIGTNTPRTPLEVDGSGLNSANAIFANGQTAGDPGIVFETHTLANIQGSNGNLTAAIDLHLQNDGGNVGIGAGVSITDPLTVQGSSSLLGALNMNVNNINNAGIITSVTGGSAFKSPFNITQQAVNNIAYIKIANSTNSALLGIDGPGMANFVPGQFLITDSSPTPQPVNLATNGIVGYTLNTDGSSTFNTNLIHNVVDPVSAQDAATKHYVDANTGLTRSVNNISTTTTLGSATKTDYVYLVSGTTTVTLPTAVGNTNLYTVKNVGSGTITINTTSSQTMDGSTTINIAVKYTSLDLISNGSNWNIV